MDFVKTCQESAYTGKKRLSLLFLVQRNGTGDNYQSNSSLCLEKSPRKGKSSHPYGRKPSGQGDINIGVCGIAVLANFSCGISVILILNCSITVFSKPAGRVFLAFWSTIVGIKNVSFTFFQPFLAVSGRFGSNLDCPQPLDFSCKKANEASAKRERAEGGGGKRAKRAKEK